MNTTEDSLIGSRSHRPDLTPEEALTILQRSSPETVDSPSPPSDASRTALTGYMGELEQECEVHSYSSLQQSRQSISRLLNQLPEVNRTIQAELAIKQEISLQESIRQRDYADIDFEVRMRRFLTTAFTWGTLTVSLIVLVSGIVAMLTGKKLDEQLFGQLIRFVQVAVVANGAIIVGFYFRKKQGSNANERKGRR